MKQRLVVIGHGTAVCRAVQEALKRGPNRCEIVIFGAELRVNYGRIMSSPVLAGEKSLADIVINDEGWRRDNGVNLHENWGCNDVARKPSPAPSPNRTCTPWRTSGRSRPPAARLDPSKPEVRHAA